MALAVDTKVPRRGEDTFPSRVEIGVAANAVIFAGSLVARNAAGFLVPAAAGDPTDVVIGRAERAADNTGGGNGAITCLVYQGMFLLQNDAVAPVTAAHRFKACWVVDDEFVSSDNLGDTRTAAGIVYDVDASGVWVYSSALSSTAIMAAILSSRPGEKVWGVRGASVANVANLALFPIANDGINLVAGDLVLLKDQTAPAENGIYIVGTVAAGNAPLTRDPDYNSAVEIKPNDIVVVAEGTANVDTAWQLTTNAPIVVGATALNYQQVPFGFGAAGAMVAVDAAVAAAGVSNLGTRIDHKHTIATAVVGPTVTTTGASVEGVEVTMARSDHDHQHIQDAGIRADIPAAAVAGRTFYIDDEEPGIMYDTGAAWEPMSHVVQRRSVAITSADLTVAGNVQAIGLGGVLPGTAMVLGYRLNLLDAFDSPGVATLDVELGDNAVADNSLCAAFDAYTASGNEGAGWVQGTRGVQPNGPPTSAIPGGSQLIATFTSTVDNLDTFTNGDLRIDVFYIDML